MSNIVIEQPTSRQLMLQVSVATLSRLFLNTSRRFGYLYIPALSQGLGVTPTAFSSLLAVNQFTGIFSPLFGPLSDRWGYRVMMIVGLGLMAVGMTAGGLLPLYGVILLALFLAGLGKSIFDPALQAYVGQYVPYRRRGLFIGIIEFAWAGSTLVGVPLVGQLIETLGWRAPFFVLGGAGLLGAAMIGLLIPARPSMATGHIITTINFGQAWQQLRRSPAALGALGFGFLASMANDNLFVTLSLWLDTFELSVSAVGSVAIVIGVAELIGELGTASIADSFGLKRSVILGIAFAALAYLLLPLIGLTVPLALMTLFLLFLLFEFGFVTSISLSTEILPDARGTMMSTLVATVSLGRVAGTLLGGPLWQLGGLWLVVAMSSTLTGLGLISLAWGLRHWQAQQSA